VRKNIAVHHDSELGEYKMIMKELGTTIEPRINYQRLTPILGHFWPKISQFSVYSASSQETWVKGAGEIV
jgi:hypothetical protein